MRGRPLKERRHQHPTYVSEFLDLTFYRLIPGEDSKTQDERVKQQDLVENKTLLSLKMSQTSKGGGSDYLIFSRDPTRPLSSTSSSLQDFVTDEPQHHGHRDSHLAGDEVFAKRRPETSYERLQALTWKVLNGPVSELVSIELWIHCFMMGSVVAFIALVIMQTDKDIYEKHKAFFDTATMALASVLTIEYILNLWASSVNRDKGMHWCTARLRWAFQFLPFVDFVVVSTYWIGEVLKHVNAKAGTILHIMQVLRLLRLLRIFAAFDNERVKRAFDLLYEVVRENWDDMAAALIILFVSLVFVGTLMYVVEGSETEGFNSIPESMYWGIITLTTIGYGDIYPSTNIGQFFCCFVAFYTVCIGAIPIGIIGGGYVEALQRRRVSEAKKKMSEKEYIVCTDSTTTSPLSSDRRGSGLHQARHGDSGQAGAQEVLDELHRSIERAVSSLPGFTQKQLHEAGHLINKASADFSGFLLLDREKKRSLAPAD